MLAEYWKSTVQRHRQLMRLGYKPIDNFEVKTENYQHGRTTVPEAVDQGSTPLKCVWNRDVSTGHNILIESIYVISKQRAPPILQRPINESSDEDDLIK